MQNDKNEKRKSQILLPIYLLGNGIFTGQFINLMRVVATRNYVFENVAPLFLLLVGGMWYTGTRAKRNYDYLYKNNTKQK